MQKSFWDFAKHIDYALKAISTIPMNQFRLIYFLLNKGLVELTRPDYYLWVDGAGFPTFCSCSVLGNFYLKMSHNCNFKNVLFFIKNVLITRHPGWYFWKCSHCISKMDRGDWSKLTMKLQGLLLVVDFKALQVQT